MNKRIKIALPILLAITGLTIQTPYVMASKVKQGTLKQRGGEDALNERLVSEVGQTRGATLERSREKRQAEERSAEQEITSQPAGGEAEEQQGQTEDVSSEITTMGQRLEEIQGMGAGECRGLNESLRRLRAAFDAHHRCKVQLVEELKRMTAKHDTLKLELQQAIRNTRKMGRVESELADANAQIAKLRDALAKLEHTKGKMERLECDLSRWGVHIHDLGEVFAEVERARKELRRIAVLEASVRERDEEIARLKKRIGGHVRPLLELKERRYGWCC